MIEAGTMLAGRYRVIRHLGTGGMASVHLAEDTVLKREVAVKRVHAAPESESGRRIVREARMGATLRHPSLVTVYDIDSEPDALLLVMEHVPGQTLADAMRAGLLPLARALEVLRAVADALDHVHERGIVHRDVKPANVLLRDDGAVKLADLGVATSEDVTQITRTGSVVGTVAYMAPEQFEPGPITPAADVYALASVAFEILAGRRAHRAETPLELMGQIREAPRPDLASERPDTPRAAADALQRGLAKDPADRPASAGALVDDLEAAFAAAEGKPPPTGPPADRGGLLPPSGSFPPPAGGPRRRGGSPSRRAAVVAALAALVVAVAVVVLAGDADEAGERASSEPERAEREARPRRVDATPVSAVRAFYERAAEGDLDGAYNLAGPRFREVVGGRPGFEDTLGSLRGIRFLALEEVSREGRTAKLRIETEAQHTTRTDRCSGTLTAVKRGEWWRVEPDGIRCVSTP